MSPASQWSEPEIDAAGNPGESQRAARSTLGAGRPDSIALHDATEQALGIEAALALGSSRVEVRPTATMGRGVFAVRPFVAGEVIGAFHSIRIPPEDVAAMRASLLASYWFEDDADGAAFLALGWIELVNHAPDPNADRRWVATTAGDVVVLFALRDIAPGEQLFIDYRFDADGPRPVWA